MSSGTLFTVLALNTRVVSAKCAQLAVQSRKGPGRESSRITLCWIGRKARRVSLSIAMAAAASESNASEIPSAVVCGAGVIGVCTAYFLAKRGMKVTIVERHEVACAASGKAGGFLALDWSDSSALGPLARLSFQLHEEMAAEFRAQHGIEYGYRKVRTLSARLQEDHRKVAGLEEEEEEAQRHPLSPAWANGPLSNISETGDEKTTAQVHPKLFTEAVLNVAVKKFGVRVVKGEVMDVETRAAAAAEVAAVPADADEGDGDEDEDDATGGGAERTIASRTRSSSREQGGGGGGGGATPSSQRRLSGVVLADGTVISATVAVWALGPWSSASARMAKLFTVSGVKAHSIVMRPKEGGGPAISADALFLSYRTQRGQSMQPEVYPRPSGDVYICGMSEDVEVPSDPAEVLPREGACEQLRLVGGMVSSQLRTGAATVVAEQACFLPCSSDGLPIIGAMPGVEGLFVGTGHSCWGILNAPATGACLADLILDGECRLLDLRAFDPVRFLKVNSPRWRTRGA